MDDELPQLYMSPALILIRIKNPMLWGPLFIFYTVFDKGEIRFCGVCQRRNLFVYRQVQ